MVFLGWSPSDYNILCCKKKKKEILSSAEGFALIKRSFESPANSLQCHLTVFVKNRTQYCFKGLKGHSGGHVRGQQKCVYPSPVCLLRMTTFSPTRHVQMLLFCLLRLADLQTWVDLTRRRGWRPSGWARQGGGHSEGRSRLRWLGNAEGGGAHREGWGMGLADGHVTSEYGSPGAYHAENVQRKDPTLGEMREKGLLRADIVFSFLSLNL